MTTEQYCEQCGRSSANALLKTILGHTFCVPCLKAEAGGYTKKHKQLLLDSTILNDPPKVTAPTPAQDDREALDYEQTRHDARAEMFSRLQAFRDAHPWVKPGMVVVNLGTADIGVIRASTNPAIGWTITWLTTAYALRESKRPTVPVATRLRIGDPDEYDEARQLLRSWPRKAHADIAIGECDIHLFEEQFGALLAREDADA